MWQGSRSENLHAVLSLAGLGSHGAAYAVATDVQVVDDDPGAALAFGTRSGI